MPTITAIDYQSNTETLFDLIRDLPYASWLDSGKPNSQYGRYDIISALPSVRLETNAGKTVKYHRQGANLNDYQVTASTEDPLLILNKETDQLTKGAESALPFIGGAIGYVGYGLNLANIIPNRLRKPASTLPDMHMGIYHWSIIQDHQDKTAYFAYLPECHTDIIEEIQSRLHNGNSENTIKPLKVESLKQNTRKDVYLEQFNRIEEYILAGDCYQVNYAHCFEGEYSGEPYSAYLQLRNTMASPFSAYLGMGNQAILSLSPERFLKTEGPQVLTQPIKGTAPRKANTEEDQEQALNLQASEKNQAENLMIVDLLRNDLGHHCVPGSIKVTSLFELQSFPNVHHLVSDITGTLRPEASSIDLLRDCFPGGSITGTPKIRAMEIIHELENRERGVYCGSIGYINNHGDMDTNIAIRTVSCDGHSLYCWGGGGIVADSKPEEEYQESLNKIQAILNVLKKNQSLQR